MFNLSVHPLDTKRLIRFGFMITLLSRILPHPPNMTAMTSFTLLAGANLNIQSAITIVCVNLLLSDVILSVIYGYLPFGSWTLFALLGYISLVYGGRWMTSKGYNPIVVNSIASLVFWLWTNLGVWMTGHGYAPSPLGLLECYTMALPFLGLSILGDLLWLVVMVFSFKDVPQPMREVG